MKSKNYRAPDLYVDPETKRRTEELGFPHAHRVLRP
jgi:hypothetical protein